MAMEICLTHGHHSNLAGLLLPDQWRVMVEISRVAEPELWIILLAIGMIKLNWASDMTIPKDLKIFYNLAKIAPALLWFSLIPMPSCLLLLLEVEWRETGHISYSLLFLLSTIPPTKEALKLTHLSCSQHQHNLWSGLSLWYWHRLISQLFTGAEISHQPSLFWPHRVCSSGSQKI